MKTKQRSHGAIPAQIFATFFLPLLPLTGQTIPNPSFEADTFTGFPGYVSVEGNGPITGWTGTPADRVGLNPADGSPFADNGIIPDGSNVAFIQGGATGAASLGTTVTGLTVGTTYKVTFRISARSNSTDPAAAAGNSPFLVFSTDGTSEPVTMEVRRTEITGSASMPYRFAACEFTATATEQVITLTNTKPAGDHTLIVDDFQIAESSGDWEVQPWTGDGDSGIDPAFVYSHAYSFGSNPGVTVNGVPFIGREAGAAGRFTLSGLNAIFANRAPNNVTGDSTNLAKDFRYGGSPGITLENLKPNTEYVFTAFGIGFDAADSATPYRAATFSSSVPDSDLLTVDLNQYGQGDGIAVHYTYTTDELATPVTISYPPTSNGTFHTSAFSNRETVASTPEVVWTTEQWFDDESSGVDPGFAYTHALNLGSSTDVNINGVIFDGVAGVNPVTDDYIAAIPLAFASDVNNFIDGYGEAMSRDFIHGGFPEVHFVSGLTPGTDYVFTIYSTGWEAVGGRVNAFSGGAGQGVTLLDQDEFGPNNGIRFEYRYTADDSGGVTITSSALNGTSPVHVTGISNREAEPLFGVAPSITLQPVDASAGTGNSATFQVGVSGSGPLDYQWKFGNDDIIGANGPILELSNVDFSNAGDYSVTITGNGTTTSETATLTVLENVPGLFATGVGQDGEPLANGEIDPHYTLTVNPDNLESTVALVQSNLPGAWLPNSGTSKWIGPRVDTSAAAAQGTDGPEGFGTYVYRTQIDLTGFEVATVRIDGSWATDNSGLAIRINGVDVVGLSYTEGNTFGGPKPFVIDFDNAPGLTAGVNTLDFVVNNSDAAAGFTGLRIAGLQAIGMIPANTAPHIASQPADRTGPHNGVATLTVGASGSAPLAYEWYRNDVVVEGASERSLPVEILDLDSGGTYKVIVSNGVDSVESEPAIVTVTNANPVAIDDIAETTRNSPLVIDPFVLILNDTDADGDSLELEGFSANSAAGGTITESGGIITYSPPAGFIGEDSFTYTVNDGIWGGVSEDATVTVTVNDQAPAPAGSLTLVLADGTVTGTFAGVEGNTYVFERSTTLEPDEWEMIETVVAPASGVIEVSDPSPPEGRAFYRIAFSL